MGLFIGNSLRVGSNVWGGGIQAAFEFSFKENLPVFFDARGLGWKDENDFGILNSSNIPTELKPVYGATKTLTPDGAGTWVLAAGAANVPNRCLNISSVAGFDFESVNVEDFTWMGWIALGEALNATNRHFMSDGIGTSNQYFINNTRMRIVISGETAFNVTYSNSTPKGAGIPQFIAVQRSGTTWRISFSGLGESLAWDSATGPSVAIDIATLLMSGSETLAFPDNTKVWCLGFADKALSEDEINEVKYRSNSQTAHSPAATGTEITGMSYSAFPSGNHFADTMHKQAHGNWVRQRNLSIGDYSVLLTATSFDDVTYLKDGVRVIDHDNSNQVSSVVELANYSRPGDIEATLNDVHNLATQFFYDGKHYILEVYPHYGQIRLRTSNGLNLSAYTDVAFYDIPTQYEFGANAQYVQVKVLNGNEIYMIYQADNNGANELRCLKTTTNFKSFESWTILKVGSNQDVWVYPYILPDDKTDRLTLVAQIIDKTVNPSPAVPAGMFIRTLIMDTADCETWANLGDSYTNEVKVSNSPIDLMEAQTNFTLSNHASGDVTLGCMHWDTTNDRWFGIEGDGSGGWNMIFVELDGTKTTKAIDDSGMSKTFVDSRNEDGGYIRKGSTEGEYYVTRMEVISGKNVPSDVFTDDDGTTWSYVGTLPNVDTGSNYNRIWGTENQHEANNLVITSCKVTSNNNGVLYARVI